MTLVQLVIEFNSLGYRIQQGNYDISCITRRAHLSYEWRKRAHNNFMTLYNLPYTEALVISAEFDLKEMLCDI